MSTGCLLQGGREHLIHHGAGSRIQREPGHVAVERVFQQRGKRAVIGGAFGGWQRGKHEPEPLGGGLPAGEGGVAMAQHGEQGAAEGGKLGGVLARGDELAVERLKGGLVAGVGERRERGGAFGGVERGQRRDGERGDETQGEGGAVIHGGSFRLRAARSRRGADGRGGWRRADRL